MLVEKKSLIMALWIIVAAAAGAILQSPAFCRICVLLLLIICLVRGSREAYFLNPYYLFATVPLSLLIYANISRYHVDLTVSTWIIAILNIAVFVISMDLTPEYRHIEYCTGAGEDRELIGNTIFLMIFSFIPEAYSAVFGRTMPMASVFSLLFTAAFVCAIKSGRKGLICTVGIITVLRWVTYVSKTEVLTVILTVLIGYEKYYVMTREQKRKLVIFVAAGLVLMIAAFGFANQGRGSLSGETVVAYYARSGGLIWNGHENLFLPYMYMTTPWTNLQYVMETQTDHTYGFWLIRPLIGYLQLDGKLQDLYRLRAYSSFNTFTYLAVCFKDFGFLGSCIISAFLGFFTKKVYSRFVVSRSPLDVVCYVFVAQAVAEMFFSNHFFTQSYPFTIVILMGMYKVLFCRNCEVELEPGMEGNAYYENQ